MNAHSLPSLTVAVVEDNADDMELLRRRLAKMPRVHIVGCHVTAEEALECIPHTQPVLVFMDILLPGMNGIQCTRLLKRKLPQLCIVMVTTVHEHATFSDALHNGADGYLTKPVSQAPIEDAVRKAMAGIPPISENMMPHLVELARRPHMVFTEHPDLSKRENEILKHLVCGHTDKEIATRTGVTEATVHSHLHHIYGKLGVSSRAQAVARCNGN